MAKQFKKDWTKFMAIMTMLSATAVSTSFVASASTELSVPIHNSVSWSKREINAIKKDDGKKRLSPFAKCAKADTQAYRIDCALQEFHTMQELEKLDSLHDCSRARIQSHVNYLQKHYSNSVKLVQEGRKFKFVTI